MTLAPGGPNKAIFPSKFELRFSVILNPYYWSLSESEGKVVCEVGNTMLVKFTKGISDILEGKGDYSIGEEPGLWFWWTVK